MFGGGVYTEADIRAAGGEPRVLSNGAVAGHVIDRKTGKRVFRIIRGVNKMGAKGSADEKVNVGMRELRSKRGKTYPGVTKENKKCRNADGSLRKNAERGCEITAAEAEAAFERHYRLKYTGHSAEAKRHRKAAERVVDKHHPGVDKRERAMRVNKILEGKIKAAQTRDRHHRVPAKRIRNNVSYMQNPEHLDFEGVDAPQRNRARTEKQRANDKRLGDAAKARNAARAAGKKNNNNNRNNQRGGQRPVSLKTAVKLLRDYYREAY